MHSRALKYFSAWRVIGWLLVLLVIYLSLTPNPPQADVRGIDKLNHLIAYLTLSVWFAELYTGARRYRIAAGLVLLGIALEVAQGMTVERTMDARDALANTLGVGIGLLIYWKRAGWVLHRIERLFGSG